ncbi:hypothetical protein LDENG_00081630 [Lucifuga dentata]|nr:hypothetical protein LDENG_00081630 [Lucifuga dentata]
MNNHGDDCYFFYYSTCTKGDSCPFRHCEAAMGNETVCNLWQEGRCFRTTCKFRHMKITKNRKEISCYWENQLAGCQKPHCAFFHEKPRYVDGVYLPPDKGQTKNEDLLHEEAAPPPAAPLPTTNPQIRGVKKAETLETVPSPTHPPVVINPADDDEDEDDQFSEEGEEGKLGPDGSRLTSPRKIPGSCNSEESLKFCVSTLEEIRLRKALKASMKRAGYPLQSGYASTNGEKENMRSSFLPARHEAADEHIDSFNATRQTGRSRGSLTERLGRKINSEVRSGAVLRSSLAERLGEVVDEETPIMAPQKAENSTDSKKTREQIRIKTLEEIRKEKAAKLQPQSQKDKSSDVSSEITITKTVSTKASKGTKRAITIRSASIGQVKDFSEILHTKKKRQEERQEQNSSPTVAKPDTENTSGKTPDESDAPKPNHDASEGSEVRVKTLEEIRREKAVKIQAQQTLEGENQKSPSLEESGAKKLLLLRIKKPSSNTGSMTTQQSSEKIEKQIRLVSAEAETSVKVKTFEEIMREKRLRKQEMQEQTSSSSQPAEPEPAGTATKRKAPARASLTPPPASSLSSTSSSLSSTSSSLSSTSSSQKSPVRKLIGLKSKAASPVNIAAATSTAVSSVSVKQDSPRQAETESNSESLSSSKEAPPKNTRSSAAPSPARRARAAPQTVSAQNAIKMQNNPQRNSPEQSTDTKVRPKLNVKPSVLKPALQLKPGQKRKAAEQSAIAAVKPLTSAAAVLQETACRDREVLPSSIPTPLQSSMCEDEPQTLPVFQQNPESNLTVGAAAAMETSSPPVSQSPVLKTPTPSKSRKLSLSASRVSSTASVSVSTSAVDDFEDLINEFTDDHLEEDVDPGIAEDDLLQELSEMIDS